VSGLKPIGDYHRLFERLSLGSYLARNPPAVLMQDASAGSFTAVSGEVDDTVTREGNAGFDAGGDAPGIGGALPREVAFMVVRLQSPATLAAGMLRSPTGVNNGNTLQRSPGRPVPDRRHHSTRPRGGAKPLAKPR